VPEAIRGNLGPMPRRRDASMCGLKRDDSGEGRCGPTRYAFVPRASCTTKACSEQNTRRLRARLGAPKAIVAMAHRLARLVNRMLRYGQSYVEKGIYH
jgi:hypothetical protein